MKMELLLNLWLINLILILKTVQTSGQAYLKPPSCKTVDSFLGVPRNTINMFWAVSYLHVIQ